jgi:ubiquitin-conjugating enzyme E2 A
MSSIAIKRINKEKSNIDKEQIEGFILLDSESLWIWKGELKGPPDTPYEKGSFPIQITFDDDYPIKPPSVKFLTPIFHPNIYRDGKICIDILQNDGWSPSQSVRTIMLSLRSLFMDPNPDSPANADAARMYKEDIDKFKEYVKNSIK